jgi:hypothetical protein
VGEHYQRGQPLSYHAERLSRDVRWYADPSGATEISELRCAGFQVSAGGNAVRVGIAAVGARLAKGTLKVVRDACPNLLAEAELYRYAADLADRGSETPEDEHNHALGALRYLVSRLDERRMAGWFKKKVDGGAAEKQSAAPKRDWWMRWDNPALWTELCITVPPN